MQKIKSFPILIVYVLASLTVNSQQVKSTEDSLQAAIITDFSILNQVTIGYDVPSNNMYQALLNAPDRTDLILKEPKPFVLQASLYKSESGNNISLTETISVRTDINKYFDACTSSGCIFIFNNNQKQWITNDTVLMNAEKLPASTFKIINLLIALETGVIKDENELFKWNGEVDTVKYGFRPETYRDMTVKEAFEISAIWVFTELAQRIGRDRYSYYLKASNYGNQNLSEPGVDFWNFGELGISPFNHVNFIRNLYEGKLPFSERNMEIVKRVMVTEKSDNYSIHAKTGWTRQGGINTGWWVGMVETKYGVWYFATLLLQDRKFNSPTFGPCRKEITKSVLRELGVIED